MTNQIMKPSLQFLQLAIKDAENIFNPYIFKDKIDELIKEKTDVSKFIESSKKENFDESIIDVIDYGKMKIEQLTEVVETLKKEVRKLKCEQRKIIKTAEKEKLEASINV